MLSPHDIMMIAPALNDDKLEDMVRSTMLECPLESRRPWLRNLGLALDGYGGAQNNASTERIRYAIRKIEKSTD